MEIQSSGGAPQTAPTNTPRSVATTETPAAAKPVAVETLLAVRQAAPAPSASELEQAVKDLNRRMQEHGQTLEFTVDNDTERTIIKLIDQNTKEVLRQIPSEEALAIAKALEQFGVSEQTTGLFIKHQA